MRSEQTNEAISAAETFFRRAPRRIGVLVGAAVFVVALLASALPIITAFLIASETYQQDASVLARTVAQSIAQPLSRAAEFGAPIGQIPDVARYLDGLLRSTSALSEIDIRNDHGKTLFEVHEPSRTNSAFMVARAPILTKAGSVGEVMATASRSGAAEPFLVLILPSLAIALLVAIVAGVLAALSTRSRITRRALRATAAFKRVVNGEIAFRGATEPAMDWAGLWSAFRARSRRISDRWLMLAAYAEEIQISDYEGHNTEAIASVVGTLREHYSLPFVTKIESSTSEGST